LITNAVAHLGPDWIAIVIPERQNPLGTGGDKFGAPSIADGWLRCDKQTFRSSRAEKLRLQAIRLPYEPLDSCGSDFPRLQ
jgi:hypothetical protein